MNGRERGCSRHGKCVVRRSPGWRRSRWLWPFIGLASLVWFLLRVIPKPSRAGYPCQRVAFPLASSFVAWVLGLVGLGVAVRGASTRLRQSRFAVAALCLAAAVAAAVWAVVNAPAGPAAADFTPSEPPNSPMGTAKGVRPGRVVWVHDPAATDWNGTSGYYWEDAHIDQAAVDRMLGRSVRWLAGAKTDAAAWDALFRHFNQARGKGDVGYQATERVTIKINLNNCGSYTTQNNNVDTSPQVTLALLRQLVNVAGVPQAKITAYDSVRRVADKIWNYCRPEFPDVRFEDVQGGSGRATAAKDMAVPMDYAGSIPTDYLPTCCTQADYLINAAALKKHSLAAVTLCAKNHFGSLCETPSPLHDSVDTRNRGMSAYTSLVELMGHEHLDGKCLLFVIDGLYGAPGQSSTPQRWTYPPFNNDWPSSLLVSQDGVAIDSVGLDLLRGQWALYDGADNYLHESALAHAPPSGTTYDPEADGTRLASLGAHEHWNNSTAKQYTRNLGTGDGIELVALGNAPPQVDAGPTVNIEVGFPAPLDGTVSGGGIRGTPGAVTVGWSLVSGPGSVTFGDPAAPDSTAAFTAPGTYVLRLAGADGPLEAHDDLTVTVAPVPPPGDLDVDLRVFLGGQLNLEAPAPRSLCLRDIALNGNPADQLLAIRLGDGPGGWLRLDGPDVARADAAQPHWHTRAAWAGRRLRGLAPDTPHAFHARARNVHTYESDLAPVGTYTTNTLCDVNRTGLATALDYALIRLAHLRGGHPGTDCSRACDVNDDGTVDLSDLTLTRDRILHP